MFAFWIAIGPALILATATFLLLWSSSELAEREWSLACALLVFASPFAVAFSAWGTREALYGMCCGMALGVVPAWLAGWLLDVRQGAERCLFGSDGSGRPAIGHRLLVVYVAQAVFVAVAVSKPLGVLAGLIALSALWAVTLPRVRESCGNVWSRVEGAVCLMCLASIPFIVTALVMTMPFARIKWSSWAPGVLAYVTYDTILKVFPLVIGVLVWSGIRAEPFIRRSVLAVSGPLLVVVLALASVPTIKASRRLMAPAAVLLLAATVWAGIGLLAVCATNQESSRPRAG
ncbi:MAG: hypothetical protein M3071_01005 [Actinomycetota bacterium]|nr:hypothetical protein [Actinomycetota bacterium]